MSPSGGCGIMWGARRVSPRGLEPRSSLRGRAILGDGDGESRRPYLMRGNHRAHGQRGSGSSPRRSAPTSTSRARTSRPSAPCRAAHAEEELGRRRVHAATMRRVVIVGRFRGFSGSWNGRACSRQQVSAAEIAPGQLCSGARSRAHTATASERRHRIATAASRTTSSASAAELGIFHPKIPRCAGTTTVLHSSHAAFESSPTPRRRASSRRGGFSGTSHRSARRSGPLFDARIPPLP